MNKEDMPEGLNQCHVDNLVNLCYRSFERRQYVQFYVLVRQLAIAFKETKKIKYLDLIFQGKAVKFPAKIDTISLSIAERIVYRDSVATISYSVGKTYNYGKGQVWRLGELMQLLDESLKQIMDILQEIILNNNINTKFQLDLNNSELGGGWK